MANTKNIAIIGASGGIGHAFVMEYAIQKPTPNIYAFSRTPTTFDLPNITTYQLDITDELSIQQALNSIDDSIVFDRIIVATGFLHNDYIMPEKSIKELSVQKFERAFLINTIGPALIAKHFLKRIPKYKKSVFAALSARVGSISDNHLGGWYAYRASKAALNMIIKNISIEIGRHYKNAYIIGLHPGTVKTSLSEPFQQNMMPEKLFSAQYSVTQMIDVIENLQPNDSGKCIAYDHSTVEY